VGRKINRGQEETGILLGGRKKMRFSGAQTGVLRRNESLKKKVGQSKKSSTIKKSWLEKSMPGKQQERQQNRGGDKGMGV